MKKKILAILLTLSLISGMALPGTMAVEAETASNALSVETNSNASDETVYTGTLICELDEHSHSEGECYTLSEEPTCGLTQTHVHDDDSCYEMQEQEDEETGEATQVKVLICEEEEVIPHEHGDGCYAAGELICATAESEGHTHGEECYLTATELTCGLSEAENHTHGDDCYTTTSSLFCTEAESAGHTHEAACYSASTPTCDREEIPEHTHSADCYDMILTCEKTEHLHTAECYQAEESLLEQLLACETLKDMFDLLNDNYDAAFTLTSEELDEIEAHADAVYAASGDDGYYQELLDIVEVLREELGSGEWQRMERTLYAGASGTSGELKYSKTLIEEGEGENKTLSIQLEAWTEGGVSTKDTEIVLVVDQSGSMHSAVDGASSAMTYSSFVSQADTTKGAQHPGYYMVVAHKVDENGTKVTVKGTDINGLSYDSYDYCTALIRYNSTSQQWERSDFISAGGKNAFDNLTSGALFNGYDEINENQTWYALSETQEFWCGDETAKYYKSIYGATMDGLFAFVDGVKDAPNCKIAIVGFATPSDWEKGWQNTGATIGGSNYGGTGVFLDTKLVHASELTEDNYKSAFMSAATEMTTITTSLQNIRPNYSCTTTQEGFMLANKILQSSSSDANKVVVLFTDGVPNVYYPDGSTESQRSDSNTTPTCNAAIAEAYKTKNTYGAKVYSFGPSVSLDANAQKMLKLCSSDFPNAQNLDAYDESVALEYSAVAGNAEAMESLFKAAAEKIYNASQLLNRDTVVKDVITPYFEIPVDEGETMTDQIKVYSVACTGVDSSTGETAFGDATDITSQVTITVTTNTDEETGGTTTTVDVTGFDYEANCVYPSESKGAKLRIVIPIKARDAFLGGNDVVTNTSDSGIYNGNDSVETFPIPDTDVVTDAEAEVIDVNVYLGAEFLQTVTVADVQKTLKVGYGGIELDLSKDDYGLADWQDDYITLDIKLYDAAGKEVTQFTEVKQDTKYTVKVTVKPSEGSIKEATAKAEGTIHVFYPEMTFSDSTGYYYGETIPANTAFSAKGTVTAWKNIEGKTPEEAGVTTMVGDGDENSAPEITFTCAPVDSTLTTFGKTDLPMDVTITKIGRLTGDNLNQYVMFKWAGCTPECDATSIADHKGNAESAEFYLHVETCQLTITKTGGVSGEPYVFSILKKDASGEYQPYTEASITGPGSVTIYELPVGEYKVAENTDWSWRFTPSYTVSGSSGNELTLSGTNTSGTVSCTNTANDEIYWLNGYSSVCINDYGNKKKED